MSGKKHHCICVIQARRTSTRLPDKVMMLLAGIPVLTRVIDRCKRITGVDEVIVAIPEGDYSNPLEDLALAAGAKVVRGSEQDVLSRYVKALDSYPSDYVMRVTSDCPLLDPEVCSELLSRVVREKADYGSTGWWPHGLDCEVATAAILSEADFEANKPLDREHVTLWIKRQAGLKKISYQADKNYMSDHRWVLDYPEDFEFLSQLFATLPDEAITLSWAELISHIDSRPGLLAINQNSIKIWRAQTNDIYEKARKGC